MFPVVVPGLYRDCQDAMIYVDKERP